MRVRVQAHANIVVELPTLVGEFVGVLATEHVKAIVQHPVVENSFIQHPISNKFQR